MIVINKVDILKNIEIDIYTAIMIMNSVYFIWNLSIWLRVIEEPGKDISDLIASQSINIYLEDQSPSTNFMI